MTTQPVLSGPSHLCHHKEHYELCYNYQERWDYIHTHKPAAERAVREKYFGLIPLDRLPNPLRQEWAALTQKGDALNRERAVLRREGDALDQEWATLNQERAALNQERAALNQERAALNQKWAALAQEGDALILERDAFAQDIAAYMATPEGVALHDELWPDCPWDEEQQTMFPRKKGETGQDHQIQNA